MRNIGPVNPELLAIEGRSALKIEGLDRSATGNSMKGSEKGPSTGQLECRLRITLSAT
jgi:hypothetical protein